MEADIILSLDDILSLQNGTELTCNAVINRAYATVIGPDDKTVCVNIKLNPKQITNSSHDKYKMFRNFMCNQLGISRADIETWTKDAIAFEVAKQVGKVDLVQIVTRYCKDYCSDTWKIGKVVQDVIREVVEDKLEVKIEERSHCGDCTTFHTGIDCEVRPGVIRKNRQENNLTCAKFKPRINSTFDSKLEAAK
jgi:hypothetical protein